jgi:hypothetical protein
VREIFLFADQSTLAQVALASKTSFELAQPLLYREVKIQGGYHIPRRFYQLLRTIYDNPSFGHRIQRLELHIEKSPQFYCWGCSHKGIGAQEFLDIARLCDLKPLKVLVSFDVWREQLLKSNSSAFTALLLYHVPNVSHLEIHEEYIKDTLFVRNLQSAHALPLARLSSIDVLHDDEYSIYVLDL